MGNPPLRSPASGGGYLWRAAAHGGYIHSLAESVAFWFAVSRKVRLYSWCAGDIGVVVVILSGAHSTHHMSGEKATE
jgi:hypothetical protein